MQVCAKHAAQWQADGIILRASEVIDGEHNEECSEPPED